MKREEDGNEKPEAGGEEQESGEREQPDKAGRGNALGLAQAVRRAEIPRLQEQGGSGAVCGVHAGGEESADHGGAGEGSDGEKSGKSPAETQEIQQAGDPGGGPGNGQK